MRRAAWTAELAFQWKQVHDTEIPESLLAVLARDIFVVAGADGRAPQAKGGAISEIEMKADGVKLKMEGDGKAKPKSGKGNSE